MRKPVFVLFLLSVLFAQCSLFEDAKPDERLIQCEDFPGKDLGVVTSNISIQPDKLIFFWDAYDFDVEETGLLALDKKELEKEWVWREIRKRPDPDTEVPFSFRTIVQAGHVLIGEDFDHLFGVDLETGECIWKTIIPYSLHFDLHPPMGNRVFVFGNNEDAFHLFSVDATNGIANELFSQSFEFPGLSIFLSNLVWMESPSDQRIYGYFTLNYFDKNNLDEVYPVYIYKIDLTSGEQVFKAQLPDQDFNAFSLFISDGSLYAIGDHLIRFDKETGTPEFISKLDESVPGVHMTLEHPFVYLMLNNVTNQFVKYNLLTGKEVWRTSLDGHQGSSLAVGQSVVFIRGADGRLYLVNKETGKLEEVLEAPFIEDDPDLFFDSEIAVDPETGYLYISDFRHLLCYDFN